MRLPKKTLGAAGIALGLGLALYALLAKKSDEELIRERVEHLAEVVRVDGPGENALFRAQRLEKELAEIFTRDVRTELPELGSSSGGRDELVGLATHAGSEYQHAEISLSKETVELEKSGKRGRFRALATLASEDDDGAHRDQRKLELGLVKTEDGWRIDSVRVGPTPE